MNFWQDSQGKALVIERKQFDNTYWLIVPVVLYHSVALLGYRVSGYIPFFLFVIWSVFQLSQTLSSNGDTITRRLFVFALWWYLIYNFIPSIYSLFGHGDFIVPLAQALNNFSLLVVVYISLRKGCIKELKLLLLVMIVGFCFSGIQAKTAIGSSYGTVQGARSIVGLQNNIAWGEDFDAAVNAIRGGLGGYTYMYVCAFLIPAVVQAMILIKYVKFRCLLGAFVIALLYCIASGGLQTPLMVAAFGVILVFLSYFAKKCHVIKYGVVTAILVMSIYILYPKAYSFLGTPFRNIGENMSESSPYRWRLLLLADTVEGDEDNYAYRRFDLQRKSFKTFCENPIFGVGAFGYFSSHPNSRFMREKTGGHSFFLDMLATRGLVGSAPFLMFVIYLVKFFKRISYTTLGKDWLDIVYVYLAVYTFAGIANPVPMFPATFYLFTVGAALHIKPRQLNRQIPATRF